MSERHNWKEEELEKLAEQYKRRSYSSEEKPRISKESIEKFAPTDLTNQHEKNDTEQRKEPEPKEIKDDVRPAGNVNKSPKQMSKFSDRLSTLGCMLPIVLGGLIPIVMVFVGLWKFSEGNVGLFILNLIAIPLATLGFTNMVRGFFKVMEDDEINLGFNKSWQYTLYFIANIAGYIAIGLAIIIVKFQ